MAGVLIATIMHLKNLAPAKSFSAKLLLLLIWILLVSGGCAHRSASTKATRDASGHTIIKFWNGFTGPDGKTMEAMVESFQKENPDVRVQMQIIPWATYYDKVTLALAYGGAPDVFICHAARIPEFASFDALRPLDDLYASSKPQLTESQFAEAPWLATFYQGKHVALPLDVHPMGMYYNTKLFREAGIVDAAGKAQPPATWEEFLADAKKLTKDTTGRGRPDQWGFVITNQETIFLTMVDQFGGSILTPDGKHGAMSSPACLAAVQRMHDLVYKYHVAPRPEGVEFLAGAASGQGRDGAGRYLYAEFAERAKGPGVRGGTDPPVRTAPGRLGRIALLVPAARALSGTVEGRLEADALPIGSQSGLGGRRAGARAERCGAIRGIPGPAGAVPVCQAAFLRPVCPAGSGRQFALSIC